MFGTAMLHRASFVALLGTGSVLAACESEADPVPEHDAGADASTLDASNDAGDVAMDAASDAEPGEDAAGHDAGDAAVDAARPDAFVPPPCTVVAPTSCPEPAPTYADVAPLIEEHCATCHSPQWTGPWPLNTYGHVADWQDDVRSHLVACTMPPPSSGAVIPDEDSLVILTWLRCGLPM